DRAADLVGGGTRGVRFRAEERPLDILVHRLTVDGRFGGSSMPVGADKIPDRSVEPMATLRQVEAQPWLRMKVRRGGAIATGMVRHQLRGARGANAGGESRHDGG